MEQIAGTSAPKEIPPNFIHVAGEIQLARNSLIFLFLAHRIKIAPVPTHIGMGNAMMC